MKKEEVLKKYLIPNDGLISWREIDNEIVFLHKEEKAFYELNRTANFIWQEAVRKKSVKEIIKTMQKKYNNISGNTIMKDTFDFINNLLKKKYFFLKNGW